MRRPRHKLQVDTFPFLAVLLAAMGSLIFLLFVFDRRAKVAAQNKNKERLEAYQQARADKLVKLEAERQAKWQAERDTLHQQLASRHQSLGSEKNHLDSDIKKAEETIASFRMQQQLLEMELAKTEADLAKEKANMKARQDGALDALSRAEQAKRAELALLTQEMLRMEAMVKNLKVHKSNEPEVYSLIPYKGKRGDQRKPLYVECLAEGLLFHPERSLLQGAQLSVENIRDEVEARGLRKAGASRDDLYVLFLIRPSGVGSYSLARNSMAIYKVDFGYELIDADWVFDFSQDDAIAKMINGKESKHAVLPPTASAVPKVQSVYLGRSEAGEMGRGGEGENGSGGAGAQGRGGGGSTMGTGMPAGSLPGTQGGFAPGGNAAIGGGATGTTRGGLNFGPAPGSLPGSILDQPTPGLRMPEQMPGIGQVPGGTGTFAGTDAGRPGGAALGQQGGMGTGQPPGVGQSSGGVAPGVVGGAGQPAGVGQLPGGVAFGQSTGVGGGSGQPAGVGQLPGGVAFGQSTGVGGGSGQPAGVGQLPGGVAFGQVGGAGRPTSVGQMPGGASFGQSTGVGGTGQSSVVGQMPGGASFGQTTGIGGVSQPLSAGQMQAGAGYGPTTGTGQPSGVGQAPVGMGSGQQGVAGSLPHGATIAGNKGPATGNPGAPGGQPSAFPPHGAPTSSGNSGAPGGQMASNQPFTEPSQAMKPTYVDPLLRPKQPPSGEEGEPGDAITRLTPTVNAVMANNTPTGPRVPPRPLTVGRIVGNREFIITLECDAERVTVFPTGKEFDMTDMREARVIDQDIAKLVQQLVSRRQATVQPGEPPYRPRLRLQVKPEGTRTYYRVYPLLMNLGIPMGRDNVE